MSLHNIRRCIRLPCVTFFHVRLKVNGRMSQLRSERKIHACSECNKTQQDIRRTRNSAKCCCSCKPKMYDYIEDVVCAEADIKENEMKMLPLGANGGKILLIKQKGKLHAIGTKCTHYGALLHTGALGDGKLRCPWHGACFNIETGDIEDYPGLDSLPCFQVKVDDNGLVHVKAKRTDLELNRRVKKMCGQDPDNQTTVVIVGGGPAAATCAESLRQENFTGNIVMVCKENVVPYDRVKVSKTFDIDPVKAALRPKSFYGDHKIEIKLNTEAIGLNTDDSTVRLSNQEKLKYDHLFICTGSKPRLPSTPGVELSNIHVLRTYTDAHAIQSQLTSQKHVVIVGLGFIGMEAASTCIGKCASVTVVGRQAVPLRAIFGTTIGERIKEQFEERGTRFMFERDIERFREKDDDKTAVGSIVLSDGEVLPADVVIIGIGSTFYTDWITGSPVEMLEDGSIVVDKYLRTSVKNVYAGGDVAYAPVCGSDDIFAAIGHYSLAHYHGKIAALNICEKATPLNTIPFFWTTLFGKSYRYAGHGKLAEEIWIFGSLKDLEFFAYYIKSDNVLAMSSVGADPIVSEFANYLQEGRTLNVKQIENDPFGWVRNKPTNVWQRFQKEPMEHRTMP